MPWTGSKVTAGGTRAAIGRTPRGVLLVNVIKVLLLGPSETAQKCQNCQKWQNGQNITFWSFLIEGPLDGQKTPPGSKTGLKQVKTGLKPDQNRQNRQNEQK